MKMKILFAVIAIALCSITTMYAQEKDHNHDKHENVDVKMEKSFICPMKCEGDKMYHKEGDCPKCGMALKEMKMEKSYQCPMKCESDKTYSEKGDCPKCGMALKKMKTKGVKKKDHHKGHGH